MLRLDDRAALDAAHPRLSADLVAAARAGVSLRAFLLTLRARVSAAARGREGLVPGLPAHHSLPPFPPWRLRSSAPTWASGSCGLPKTVLGLAPSTSPSPLPPC